MTLANSRPAGLIAEKPSGVQPGGGWCMTIELAWGRCRRRLLRWLRPGYVRRMAERRLGDCPSCQHDVIDARDLKYCRNVCGYWFHPEDSPFHTRGPMGLARYGLAELLLFSLLLGAAAAGFAV